MIIEVANVWCERCGAKAVSDLSRCSAENVLGLRPGCECDPPKMVGMFNDRDPTKLRDIPNSPHKA